MSDNAVCRGRSRIQLMGNSPAAIQCLFSEPLNSLCNTVGEFQVLARTSLKSPGQSHEVSRNVITCVLVVGGGG